MKSSTNPCAICSVPSSFQCAACKSVYYCSAAHQKEDWKRHKISCKRVPSSTQINPQNSPNNAGDTQVNSRVSLAILPSEVLFFIGEYLRKPVEEMARFTDQLDWLRYIHTNQRLFREYKRNYYHLFLNRPMSAQYMASEVFRRRVRQVIAEPRKQLRLDFVRPEVMEKRLKNNPYNLEGLSNVHSMMIQDCYMTSFVNRVENVEKVSVLTSGFTDVSIFSAVKKLDFSSRLNDCEFDLSVLQSGLLEEFTFGASLAINYEVIVQNNPNLRKITFQYCDSITDVSCFANVPSVSFIGCKFIHDVSPLHNCDEVDLTGCFGVSDVSSLGRVKRLVLKDCSNVNNVTGLESVQELDLSGFRGNDVSKLAKVKKLVMWYADGVTDLSGLLEVEELDIRHGKNIVRLPTSVKTLMIYNCPLIEDLSSLTSLTSLNIIKATAVKPSLIFRQLKILEIDDVNNVEELIPLIIEAIENYQLRELTLFNSKILGSQLKSFRNLRVLTLKDFPLTEVPSLPYLRSLTISSCANLRKIERMPKLEYLSLHLCHVLTQLKLSAIEGDSIDLKASPLSCEIFDCQFLREIKVLRVVSDLEIGGCDEIKKIVNSHLINYLHVDEGVEHIKLR